MKIRPVGAELFHAEGRTEMSKLQIAFRNIAKALKNLRKVYSCVQYSFSNKEGQSP